MEKATSFDSDSACGLDGFSRQYFKDIIVLKVSDLVQSYWVSLAKLVNNCKDDKLPRIFSNIFGIRPIAVSLTWRRLVSKIVNAFVIKNLRVVLNNQAACNSCCSTVYLRPMKTIRIKLCLKLISQMHLIRYQEPKCSNRLKLTLVKYFHEFSTCPHLIFNNKNLC